MKVFLCSDFHLGMRFAGYPDAVREKLVEARFTALERCVRQAGEAGADLLLVAGDLFDRAQAARRDVERAARLLAGFAGKLAAVLPGNHDFLGTDGEPWRGFRDAAGGSVLVLEEPRPYPLEGSDIDACLYPGPCTSKHSKANAVGWVREARRSPAAGAAIGVAHGGIEGISPDFDGDYYPMRRQDLAGTGVPLWLVGHTHVRYPQAPGPADTLFIPGTPEPDGFDCAHGGGAWLLTLDGDGPVRAEAVRTGTLGFSDVEAAVATAADLQALERRLGGTGAAALLLRLRLVGRVPRDVREEVIRMRGRLAEKLLHLDLRLDGLREEITRETIDAEFAEGSFPHALLCRLREEDDLEALEAAHALLGEARR